MFHSVSVKVKFEDDKGKLKTKTEKYLVDAMSVTEAEARVTSYMKGTQVEFEISSASQSRIVDVINPNNTPEVYAK
jgi:predicted RNA-binding protein Jag